MAAEPLEATSPLLGPIWISQSVNSSMESMWSLSFTSRTRCSSSQNRRVLPVCSSHVMSSTRGPFSMLLATFSYAHMRMVGPLVELTSSDRRLAPMVLVFCLYGTAPQPAVSARTSVKRVGIFLLPL